MTIERKEADKFFENSFLALTGYAPMRWQTRLFYTHFLSSDLPSAISIPTGLGKTALMAVWLIGLAWQMRTKATLNLPRRLVYVVDRRAVVDQSTTFAENLRKKLGTPEATELRTALGFTEDQKLAISTLRGQFVDNREWLEDPSRPAVIIGTVDMVGSRLLFEGYGISRKMRPYHAGLLGADALVLLDEAHLVPPFEALLATIAGEQNIYGARSEEHRGLIPAFRLLPLSATSRSSGAGVFALEAQDYDDPDDAGAKLTKQRLDAVKRLRFEEGGKDLPKAIADRAWKIADDGKAAVRCLIFCDKRDDAQKVHDELSKMADAPVAQPKKGKKGAAQPTLPQRPTIELFVGARRVHERTFAQQRLEELGFLAGSGSQPSSSTFLVATSAGEVGVDLDADHMVCDLVPWERMVQRLGRVNRRGGAGRDAQIVVFPAPEPEPGKPAKDALEKVEKDRTKKDNEAIKSHEDEVEAVRALRKPFGEALKAPDDGDFDVSPGALQMLAANAATDETIRNVLSAACSPTLLRPALTRPLVDAWSMTSLELHTGRPRIEPWLRGWTDDLPQTAVAWREHLPVRDKPPANKKEIKDYFEAAPIQAAELLETETFRVIDWLRKRIDKLRDRLAKPTLDAITEVVETPEAAREIADRDILADDDAIEQSSELAEGEEALSAPVDTDDAPQPSVVAGRKLKPDDIVGIMFSASGDYSRAIRARDVPSLKKPGNAAQMKQHEEAVKQLENELPGATLVLRADLGGLENGLLKEDADAPAFAADGSTSWGKGDSGKPMIPFRVRDSVVADAPETGEWREAYCFDLERADGEATRWLAVEEWPDSANTEERRASGPDQSLVEHQSWAERCARRLGERLGVADEYLDMLAIAARLHDEGKQAQRWQNAFRAKRNGRPYAKTQGPIDFKLLDGYRHEFGSLPHAQKDEAFQNLPQDLQDLALHLIASHHGFARPVIATNGCEDAPPSALETRAREVAVRFARLQRRWGPWGLAWWEALLRAADQQASRENDARRRKSNKESD